MFESTRRPCWGVGLLLAAALGCSSAEDGAPAPSAVLTAAIQADLLEGAAPLDVSFSLVIGGAELDEEVACTWDFGDGQTSDRCDVRHLFQTARTEPYIVRAGAVNLTSGQTATATPVAITVRPRPDLTVSGVVTEQAEVDAGGTFNVSFVVTNQGGTATPATEACVYLVDSENRPSAPLGRIPLVALAPQELTSIVNKPVETGRGRPGGNYFVAVKADCGESLDDNGAVYELDEKNNSATSQASLRIKALTEGPDLTIRSLVVSPTTVLVGLEGHRASLQLGFKISNVGNRAAGAFRWTAHLAHGEVVDPQTDLVLAQGEIPGLQAGRDEPIEQGVDLPANQAEGGYRLIVTVDPDDRVASETDEFNNAVAFDGTVVVMGGSIEGYDLILTGVRVSNLQIPTAGSIDVAFTLCNRGTLDIRTNFFVSVYLSSEDQILDEETDLKIGNVNLTELTAQTCIDARLTKLLPPSVAIGSYYIGIWADPSGSVAEVEEGNNTIWNPAPVSIGELVEVDLSVERVSFAPSEVVAGDQLQVAYTLRNFTPHRTGAFVTAIVLSADDEPSVDDRRIATLPTPYLDGAEERQVDELVTIPLDIDRRVASWYVGVLVDPDDEVREVDDENNQALAPGTLAVTGGQGGCVEDRYEPNDTYEDAAQIGVGARRDLGRCGNDDWYGILVNAGESISVTITYDQTRGALELRLLDADGSTVLDGSATRAGREQVQALLVPMQSLFYIQVAGERRTELQYDLELDLAQPQPGVDLQVTGVSPVPLELLLGQPLQVGFDLINFGRDQAPATRAQVYLSEDPELDDGDAELGQVDVAPLAGSSRSRQAGTFLPPLELAGGSYIVLVQADAGRQVLETDETNNLGRSGYLGYQVPPDTCQEDALEPNNYCGGATPLDPGVHQGLVVCERFDDWYALELRAGDCINLALDFESARGDLDLEVFQPDCQQKAGESHGAGNREQVDFCVAAAGTYYARVFYFRGVAGHNGYQLTFNRLRCEPDRFEPNDAPAQAQRLNLAGEADLTACSGDIDYYLVSLMEQQPVTFRTVVDEALPLTLTLYQVGNPPVFLLSKQGEPLSYTPPAGKSGDYLLRVRQQDGAIAHYQLLLEGLEGMDIKVRELAVQPAEVTAGGLLQVRGALENGRVEPLPSFEWGVFLSTDTVHDAGDRLLGQGLTPGEIPPGGRFLVEDRFELPADLLPGRWFMLLVADLRGLLNEVDEANNLAAAEFTVVQVCLPDRLEPNHRPDQAAVIGIGALQDLSICRGDVDWFAHDVDQVQVRLTVTLDSVAALGDLDLFVYAQDGTTLLGRSTTARDREQVLLEQPAPGRYLIKVQGLGVAENSYSLAIQ